MKRILYILPLLLIGCKTLWVSSDGGNTYLALPDGALFPFNNIADLSTISLKASDNTAGLTVTFRYEV